MSVPLRSITPVAPLSDERCRAIVEAQAELVCLSTPEGTLVYVNPAYARHFGGEPTQFIGRSVLGQVHAADLLGVQALFDTVLTSGESRESETRSLRQGQVDDVRWLAWTNAVQPDSEHGVLLLSVGRDITDRKKLKEALHQRALASQRQAEDLRLVTDAIPSTVVVVGADGRYQFVNDAFTRLTGLARDDIIGHTATEVLGEAEVQRRRPFMVRAFTGEAVHFELDYPEAAGTTWLGLSCIPRRRPSGEVDGFVGISHDITAQRRERDRLTELSQRDPLTGLLNRTGFELRMERSTQSGQGSALGLLYIDLDHFKPVNDTHGHPVGDQLLQAVAQRLSGLVRPSDAVARLGGDEFAIVLVEVGQRGHAERIAAKVVAAIGQPFEVDGRSLAIGASVGVAVGVAPRGDWRELVQRADALLYRAKADGRGRHAS